MAAAEASTEAISTAMAPIRSRDNLTSQDECVEAAICRSI